MNDKPNGGPAFPVSDIKRVNFMDSLGYARQTGPLSVLEGGMTLRDYFAAKAMQGLVTRIGKHDADLIAHDAYAMADTMIKARSA